MDDRLDRLLKEAYPQVAVSPDFTLRLWRRLMKTPARPPWMLPVPAMAAAVAIGIAAGFASWISSPQRFLSQPVRLDLLGNAPFDSVAGSYLKIQGDLL